MYAERFSPLIREHPLEADSLARIADYFGAIGDSGLGAIRLDPQRLFDIAQAGSTSRFVKVVSLLMSARLLERKLVIFSPTGNGIMSVKNVGEVPLCVHDPFRDVEMEVTDENLRAVYLPITE